jgi:hypothetical protein
MSPKEVEGLQGLAMAQGGSLTINPDTGLPEAFILPMLGGAALSKFMSPMAAGLLIGGATALTSGDIGKGIMAGLGGYGGADLGKIFTKMGTQSVGGMPVGAPVQAVKESVAQNAASNLGMFNAPGATATMGAAGNVVPGAGLPSFNNLGLSDQIVGPGVNSTINAMGAAPSSSQIAQSTLAPSAPSGTYGQMGEGFGKLIKDPFDKGFEAFKQAGGEGGIPLETGEAAMKLGAPVAGAALSLFEPPMPEPYVDPDTGKYRGPQGQLNLSDRFNTGLRLAAKGGAIKSYALGGNVGNPSVGGGLSSLYNRPEGQAPQNISNDAYGLGRLSDLGSEQARYQAQTLGYADGGDVVAGEKGMNLDQLPTLSVETGKQTLAVDDAYNPTPFDISKYTGYMTPNTEGSLRMAHMFNEAMKANPTPYDESKYTSYMSTPNGPNAARMAHMFSNFKPEAQKAFSNFVSRPRYAQGGYLDGDGDGMSDSIPATIEGKQPARLADGEFVIPADVVSHLGNGSSKAGSKRLYAMLDKVRHARTGNKKQGKQIKADKYLPV